jgi:probable rRNA maturation factor
LSDGYDISLEVTLDAGDLDVSALIPLASTVMAGEGVAAGTTLALLVTGDEEVRRLNKQFLGIDDATDVLSFPDSDDADFVSAAGGAPHLGDIAIALPTAIKQAAEVGHALDAEVAHLLVHGVLHLLGYDHVDNPVEELRMRTREEHYLHELGAVHHH